MKKKLILIGNGMAGVRTLEELLKIDAELYDISVFGAEPYGNYNRIMLSPVLAGEKTIDEIMINDRQWYEDNGITLHTGHKVTKIHRKQRQIVTDQGMTADYDYLLLATGSDPFIIPVPGADLPGVISFRDIHDVDAMLEAAKSYKNAVVIGGGLLGLEAANGLMKQGMQVTVVHLMDTLMERQMDAVSGSMLKASLLEKGMQFQMQASTTAILGEERVTGVSFKDGTQLAADIVIMAVGIKPNTTLAKSAGLYCERGVLVNDTMQTYDPAIYAVGECVQHRQQTYGLVAPLFEQGKVCANHLAQMGYARYEGSVTSTKLKVTGIDLFSAGDFQGNEDTEDMVFQDPGNGVYKKIVLQDGRIQGAVMYGDTVDGSWYFDLLRNGTDISSFRDTLLFGQAHLGDAGHGEENRAALLPDSAEICGCNGITKGCIIQAITEHQLFTLDEVKAHTKASASCGSCTGLVEQILASTLGADYSSASEKKPLCPCTDLSHAEVRKAITAKEMMSIPEVMDQCGWSRSDGCHVCRPALNYYLLCAWPKEYKDDAQSRFINERAHANIQKDGSYSVIPRMWGGLTNPKELRAIADAAEKYHINTVKVTGGQRIDLLGVTKEDLPKIWGDLNAAGMVSGHAYGKSLRTVKTCVGQEWCRFGTQDSTGLGVKIEKMTWGCWTPHKFKIAVSGCPRNCAEASIKDLGVVCVDSGYEIHVGGNGGIKVRITDMLCKVDTEEEVMEYTGAFMQMYREQAHYLDRTAHWIERVGLAGIKKTLIEDAVSRKALYERFLYGQQFMQDDPWAQRAKGQEQHEFTPIKTDLLEVSA